jgi:hypothetical protein
MQRLPLLPDLPWRYRFASIPAHSVRADFAGGGLSSDLGPVLLRGIDLQIGLTKRIAAALPDRRHQRYVNHSYHDMLTQRIYQTGCGHEDGNDSNRLRHDPMFKLGAARSPFGEENAMIMRRVLQRIRRHFPDTHILVRGDGHFSGAELMGLIDSMPNAVRLFDEFTYKARSWPMAKRSMTKSGSTLGADKGYDAAEFVKELRELKITPHVAQKKHSAIDARTTRHKGYDVSLKKRKLVEEIFGWSKTIDGLRKARFVGLAKVRAQTIFTFAAYNLTRMATIFGWRLSTV